MSLRVILTQFLFQVCRNINRIKVCMETGQTVVLLNLENLYESLYDALNQVTPPGNTSDSFHPTLLFVLKCIALKTVRTNILG